MEYLDLLIKAEQNNIKVHDYKLTPTLKGLYYNGNIAISQDIETFKEKKCILAEELGHYFINKGNILSPSEINNVKQEKLGRNWGFEQLISLPEIISLRIKKGIRNMFELSEELNVTEEYLKEALEYYKNKYGIKVFIDQYILNLDTLEIVEALANNEFQLNEYIKKYKD